MHGLIKASHVDGLIIRKGWGPLEVCADMCSQLADIRDTLCSPAALHFKAAMLSLPSCRQHALIQSCGSQRGSLMNGIQLDCSKTGRASGLADLA